MVESNPDSKIDGLQSDSNSEPDDLEVLLFEKSPYGNIDALVQHDGRAVYFYLNGAEPFGTRACWVQNLVAPPLVINQRELELGVTPLMPKTHCEPHFNQDLPDAEWLTVVWLEEGNGAALLDRDGLLAVIPPWSGTDGFHGYARNCIAENELAWPLPQNDQLSLRIENARQFWEACASESSHPFADLQPIILDSYTKAFGSMGQYYCVDGGQFPPRGAVVIEREHEVIVASVAMSLRPQPGVEMAVENPADLRRIELAICLPTGNDQPFQPLLEQFSGLIAYPWRAQNWFGHGHTLKMPVLKKWSGDDFEAAVFVDASKYPRLPSPELRNFRNDPVRLLWLHPISTRQENKLQRREVSVSELF